ncbi:MAG: hypothetical protein FWG80_03950 [Alphaproteobacteria bacterium]|nr:hypothetical protein [Alphaproteobacteria bacterium]
MKKFLVTCFVMCMLSIPGHAVFRCVDNRNPGNCTNIGSNLWRAHGCATPGASEFFGTFRCSDTPGTMGTKGTPSNTGGAHCWCNLTRTPNGGWVYADVSAGTAPANLVAPAPPASAGSFENLPPNEECSTLVNTANSRLAAARTEIDKIEPAIATINGADTLIKAQAAEINCLKKCSEACANAARNAGSFRNGLWQ